ncbi:transposase, partial [Escherichia coli]|uniref:transposase n=1 Tax=Escherichia coli TaxID=562 RepID=UPI002168C4A2
ALALLKREGRCPSDVEHRQIKYRNNVIECDHGKLKRIIGATLGFKSMKTAYATIKGIEVMRALRKGQASAFYYGDPLPSTAGAALSIFISPPVVTAKLHTGFWVKSSTT